MLLLADADADRGDHWSAVELLDCAARVVGELPPEYELKRNRWRHAVDAAPERAGMAA
jgi:hypothetical protein